MYYWIISTLGRCRLSAAIDSSFKRVLASESTLSCFKTGSTLLAHALVTAVELRPSNERCSSFSRWSNPAPVTCVPVKERLLSFFSRAKGIK